LSKKLLLGIVLVCLLVLGISCCHWGKDVDPAQNTPVSEPQEHSTPSSSPVDTSENTGYPSADPGERDSADPGVENKTSKDKQKDQEIVIKTENKGSGEEADEMLEEVDRQLDALIKALDALDTVELEELQNEGGEE
jgi:hypothetical protein